MNIALLMERPLLEALKNNKPAIAGFILICLFGAFARSLNGAIYEDSELMNLLDSIQRSGLYLCSAIATVSGTTLALMLTMIGLVRRIDEDFDFNVYRSVSLVSVTSATSLVVSVILLLVISIPIGEFDGVPTLYYKILYEVTFTIVVFLCAISAATVLILLSAILAVVRNITPKENT